MDESRHPGGAAPADDGADAGRQAERPVPLPDWPASDIAWRPREADWAAEAAWSDLDTRWATGSGSWGDPAETKQVGRRAGSVQPYAKPVDLGSEPSPTPAEPNLVEADGAPPGAESRPTEAEPVDASDSIAEAEAARGAAEPGSGAARPDLRDAGSDFGAAGSAPGAATDFDNAERAVIEGEPAVPRGSGDTWRPPAQADPTWADLSARYPELLPPPYGRQAGRKGHSGNNGRVYGRAHPPPGQPVERPQPAPVSPSRWPSAGYERSGEFSVVERPTIPQPRPAAPADRSAPPADQPATRPASDRRDPPADRPPARRSDRPAPDREPEAAVADPSDWAAPGSPVGWSTDRSTQDLPQPPAEAMITGRHAGGQRPQRAYEQPSAPRVDRQARQARPTSPPDGSISGAADATGRGEPDDTSRQVRAPESDASPNTVEPPGVEHPHVQPPGVEQPRVEPHGIERGGVAEPSEISPQPAPIDWRPADHLSETSAEPAGWTPPGVFALRRQGQPDDDQTSGWVRRLLGNKPAQAIPPASPRSESAPGSSREPPSAPPPPPPPPAQPAAAPTEAPDAEALPQRIPAEPDVPTAPEPAVDTPAETPELARIASHLRRADAAPSHERPEGFDVNAILAAVREVPGVADASLRTTPAGAHKLRLDLSEGADSAEVSRRVARLLQERMGLAAGPHDLGDAERESAIGPERRVGASAGAPSGPDAALGTAPAASTVEPGEPMVSRRRRSGGHRGPSGSGEAAAARGTAAVGTALGSSRPVAGRFPGGRLAEEPILSRPLRLGSQPGPRVRIEHVQVSTYGLEANVQVRLTAGGRPATGLATGPAVDSFVLRLCAGAAAAAVDELLRRAGRTADRGRCFVEQAAVVQLGGCDVATVVVLLVYDGWVEQLAGSALVTGDPREAVVRATLAAINRRLEALLS